MIDVIATIGPSSKDFSVLKKMKEGGMTIARVNMKHSPFEELLEIKEKLDKLKIKLLVDILDLKQADLIRDINPQYVALAFTKSALQISKLRKIVNSKTLIIAKIENRKGIENIKRIIEVSDGLMVARGDLCKNVPYYKLPVYQKKIIADCNKKEKYVITATEMLLSMVNFRIPTKAEVSDVANAVLDGSNALMLSEETAIGEYPAESVRVMRKIIDYSVLYKNYFKC